MRITYPARGHISPHSDVLIKRLTVSWDFRPDQLDRVTTTDKRVGYKQWGNRKLQIAGSQTNAAVGAEYNGDRTAGKAFKDVGRYCKLRAARKLLRYHLPRAFSEGDSVQYGRVVTGTASELEIIE